MLDFCQPVSYYLKLSVLWVKKLLSEVVPLTYSPISLTPYPYSDSLVKYTDHTIEMPITQELTKEDLHSSKPSMIAFAKPRSHCQSQRYQPQLFPNFAWETSSTIL